LTISYCKYCVECLDNWFLPNLEDEVIELIEEDFKGGLEYEEVEQESIN
jgi:hypothetical protein